MGLRLIRQSSDTPSVSNTDDVRMVRYAYGGEDGVVKNYGTELAPTINDNTLKIGSGCVVLHGWEVVLDANGYDVAVDNIDVLRYYSVYLEINLATESFAIKTLYDTAGYPEVETGEDLTAQTTGTARLPLYQFTAKSGVIENVTPKFSIIKYVKEQMQAVQNKFDGVEQSFTTVNQTITALQDRLSVLGFKEAVISGAESGSYVYRQGNYVIGCIKRNTSIMKACQGMEEGDVCDISYGITIKPSSSDPYYTFVPKNGSAVAGVVYSPSVILDPNDTNGRVSLSAIIGSSVDIRLRLTCTNSIGDNQFYVTYLVHEIYFGYEAVAL